MKKYKLKDLVANGSRARLKVDSDLLVGDVSNGYGYGDILDANAVKEMIDNSAAGTADVQDLKDKIDAINELDASQQQRITELEQKALGATVQGNNLIISGTL